MKGSKKRAESVREIERGKIGRESNLIWIVFNGLFLQGIALLSQPNPYAILLTMFKEFQRHKLHTLNIQIVSGRFYSKMSRKVTKAHTYLSYLLSMQYHLNYLGIASNLI